MKKKFFFKFFLFTVIASLVTFTACKDYDDDIDMLDEKIEDLRTTTTSSQASMKAELQGLIGTAQASADAADAKAVAAQAAADAAQATGNSASAAAAAAQSVADAAVADAAAAQDAADAAAQAATAAQDAADAAQNTANEAKTATTVNAAAIVTNAAAAQDAADAAQDAADAAQAAAEKGDIAQAAADAAQEAADDAQDAADAAQDAADAAQNSANTNADNIVLNAAAAQAAADAAQDVADALALFESATNDKLLVLEDAVEGAQAAADAAQDAANAAQDDADAAQDAADAAQSVADQALIDAETANDKADALLIELNALKERVVTLEGKVVDLRTDVNANKDAHEALDAVVADMKVEIADMKLRVMELFGKRITSVTLVPKSHLDGIAAITFRTLGFLPQEDIEDWNDQGMYGYTTTDITGAPAVTTTDNSTIAEFRLSPRYVTKNSIGFPYFESIVSENIVTYSVDEANAGVNTPIAPVEGQELNVTPEGILKLKLTKTIDGSVAHETDYSGSQGYAEQKFYFASLAIPVADEYLTAEEKADGGAVVTSEHYRINEITTTPKIKSAVAGDIDEAYDTDGTLVTATQPEDLHYYPYALDADGLPVHYSSANMLYSSASNANIDQEVVWDSELDLNTLVAVGREEDHTTVDNFADYGLAFKFEVAEWDYLLGGENQQDFASIDDEGILTSQVGPNDETPIGSQPIIKVSLLKDNNVVDVRYIKVKFVLEPVGPVTIEFPSKDAECDTVQFITDDATMLAEFYTPTNLTNDEFHARYTWETGVVSESVGTVAVVDGKLVWTLTPAEQAANMGEDISQTGTFTYDDHVIEVTLQSSITQPEITLQGLIDNYWFDGNTFVKFNTATPALGDDDPNNNTFVTNINNIFDTDGSGDIILPTGYSYEYVFVDIADQPVQEYGEGADKITITVSADGKQLFASRGSIVDEVVAQIVGTNLEYTENDLAKELLNVDAEFMKARLSVKVYNECELELNVTGLGNDDAFNVHFLRPVNVEEKSPEAFVDAVDFGAPGSIIELEKLVKLADWRNYVKDTDQYFFDPNNPTYYDYYDVTDIDVDTADIVPVGLKVDGVDKTSLPTTIEVLVGAGGTYGTLTYDNNGANLSGDFTLQVPVTVTYKWGEVTTIVDVLVKKTSDL